MTPNYRLTARNQIIASCAVGFLTVLILLAHSPSRSYLSQVYSLSLPTNSAPSAWFSDNGYLRFDGADGWGSVYETREEAGGDYSCDAEDTTASGGRMCFSTIRLLRALVDNSVAQNMTLEHTSSGMSSEAGVEMAEEVLQRTYEELKGLRGKRILYLGDSTDRFPLDEMAAAMPTANRQIFEPVSGTELPEEPTQWSQHTTRFIAIRLAESAAKSISAADAAFQLKDVIHPDEFRVDFLFTFGLFDSPSKDAKPEDFLERVDLLDPLLGPDLPYDLICIDAGLWDMEKFARELPEMDVRVGLTSDWVDSYIERYILVIENLRIKYGAEVPIAVRLTHDLVHAAPKFSPLRSEHLRQAQLEVIRRTGTRALPMAERMRSQAFFYRPDGYHPSPAADMIHTETMLRLLAEV